MYKPEFCQVVIDLGKQGASKVEMAATIGVSRATFDNFEKEYPEFLEAVKQAVVFSQGFWERKGREATFGLVPGFNATAWTFNMKNRFKEDWRDRVEQEHTGANGGEIQNRMIVEFVHKNRDSE